MNAKKIMGAVLVALLAAALFIGAGAAAITEEANGKVVFVNQKLDAAIFDGNWIGPKGGFTPYPSNVADIVYFPTGTEGVYTYVNGTATYTLTVKSPEVIISGIAGTGAAAYKFIPGIYYLGSGTAVVDIVPAAYNINSGEMTVYVTLPNGQETTEDINSILNDAVNKPAVGEYSITVVFDIDDFVDATFVDQMSTKPVTFNVAEAGDVAISASVDQALKGESFIITITGQPGAEYQVSFHEAEDFEAVVIDQKGLFGANAQYIDDSSDIKKTLGFKFTMPNTGKVDVVVASTSKAEDTEKITVVELVGGEENTDNNASVTVKLAKGTISAKTEAASYFVGDKVKIIGVSTAGKLTTELKLDGRNFEATVTTPSVKYGTDLEMTFEFELDTAGIDNDKEGFDGKMIDVGTYTLTITTETGAKATVPVTLKQPFISIVEAPEVIVKGNEAEFIINAEATEHKIQFYIFGTNFFLFGDENKVEQGEEIKTQYTVKFTEEYTANLSEGQYFAVFQHPMYDQEYNVTVKEEGSWIISKNNVPVIDVKERQTANAAQALCDELDSQNIDDMYVKASFFVVGKDQSFTISDIPKEVAKGTTFTISGVDTANAGKTVQVEMISTAFAAVPKETVGSAAFIVVTTEVAEDGTWEVTLDTSDLNVDEYSLSVAINSVEQKNVNINVVEAADKPDTPVTPPADDKPEQPEEPVAPETPGFGALAALAGLGAVAVLLLRRE